MQIVIDIDDDTYRYMQSRCKYQNKGDKGLSMFEKAGVAIKNGKILPKGHGRLIDAEVLRRKMGDLAGFDLLGRCIDEEPTIIKADGGAE